MQPNLPVLLIGFALIVVGIVLWIFRVPVTNAIVSGQKATFGKVADPIVRGAKPEHVAIVAIGWVAFGIVIVALGIFLPPYHGG